MFVICVGVSLSCVDMPSFHLCLCVWIVACLMWCLTVHAYAEEKCAEPSNEAKAKTVRNVALYHMRNASKAASDNDHPASSASMP